MLDIPDIRPAGKPAVSVGLPCCADHCWGPVPVIGGGVSLIGYALFSPEEACGGMRKGLLEVFGVGAEVLGLGDWGG